MVLKFDLPFKVGEEVEAKFNETGYRGAWFRCRILEIKPSTADYDLLLEYLDFEEEGNSWVKVRQADPSVSSQKWCKGKKPLIWMARPVPPLVHERDIKKYQDDIREGRKKAGCVYVYNDDVYTVGDMVEWWKDDCYWTARIIEMKSKKRRAKIRFPSPPHGEGSADIVPLKNLRPCFTWSPPHQWTQVGSKRRDARGKSETSKIDKAQLALIYLSGHECTSTVVPDDHRDGISSGNVNFRGDLELFEEAAHGLRALGHERRISGGSHELVVTPDRHNEDSACKPVVPQSASDSKHGTEEQSAKSSVNGSDIVPDIEGACVNIGIAHAISSDAAADQSQLVTTSPRGDETDSQAVLSLAGEITEKFESIDGFGESNPTSERCTTGTAVHVNDGSVTASVDLSHVKSVRSGDGVENLVATPGNAVHQSKVVPEMSVGIGSSDTITSRSSASETFACANVAELPITAVVDPQDNSTTIELVVAERTALDSPGKCIARRHAGGFCDPESKVDTDATSNDSPCVNLLVHAEDIAAIKNPLNTNLVAARAEELTDVRAEQLSPVGNRNVAVDEVTISGFHFNRTVANVPVSIELNHFDIPPDGHVASFDPRQEQPTEGLGAVLNDDGPTPLSSRKLSSHVSCVAIQHAVKLVYSRKRRRKKEKLRTGSKRVCHAVPHQTVGTFVSQTDGLMHEPLIISVPTTPSNDEKRISTSHCTVNREAGTNAQDSRISEVALTSECQEYGCTPSAGVENDSLARVLALSSIHEQRLQAVEASARLNSRNDTESGCQPGSTGNCDLNEHLDALERLIERVHSLGDQLHGGHKRKWKRVFWKMSDGSVFSSEARRQSSGPTEAVEATRDFVPSSDLDNAAERLPCLLAQATYAQQNDEVTSSFEVPNDLRPSATMKSRSNLTVTKGIKKCRSARTLVTCKTQTLSFMRNKLVNDVLLKSANAYSKLNNNSKRIQDEYMGPEKVYRKARLDVTKAVLESVHNSATCSPAVEPSRMRGSINNSKGKRPRLKHTGPRKRYPKTENSMVVDVRTKEKLVDSAFVGLQIQNLEDVLSKQESGAELAPREFRTKSRLSGGSNHETAEPVKLDPEVIDNHCQDKIKLQPNGNWCIKSYTIDGKPVWIGNYQTKELALNSYAVVNMLTCPKVKVGPHINHPSCPGLSEQANGDHLSPAHVLEENELQDFNVEKGTRRNVSESCLSVGESKNRSMVLSMDEDRRKTDGFSSLGKTSLVDEQGVCTVEKMTTAVESCNQGLSVKSTKADASISWTKSEEGNTIGSSNAHGEMPSRKLTRGPLSSPSTINLVVADRGVLLNRNNRDNFPVKSEVSELPTVAAAVGSAHHLPIHDFTKFLSGKDALDRISMDNFETKEEKEVATQARTALWRGLCCSPPHPGLVSQGLDVVQRINFFIKSRMHFEVVADGDLKKILLSSGKLGEEIYIGHWKTDVEVHAARKIITRCKKALVKLMIEFELSSKRSDSSIETHAERTVLHEKPINPSYSTERLNVPGLTLINEVGQPCSGSNKSSTTAGGATQDSASARALSHRILEVAYNDTNIQASAGTVAALDGCQAPPDSRTVGGQANFTKNQSLFEDIIILDDDDDDDANVPPARSIPPSSVSDRLFRTETVGKTFNRNLDNNTQLDPLSPIAPSQRQSVVHVNRGSRAGVLLGDRSSYPGQIHNQGYHFTVDPFIAGPGGTRQTVHKYSQTGNSSADPIIRVQHTGGVGDAQTFEMAHTQSLRRGGLGNMNMVATPSSIGNVVHLPGNRHGGVPTESSFRNRLNSEPVSVREVSSSYSRENHSIGAATLPYMSKKFYDCCPDIEPCKEDFITCKGLFCGSCNRLVHTHCALLSKHLNLTRFPSTGQEHAVYRCFCGRSWDIVPIVLIRMKDFIRQI